MSALTVTAPFPIFTDTDGAPLENGYVYVGTTSLNAETNPIQVYWDAALSIPAAQPIRTIGGYASRNGSPGQLYVNAVSYSIIVRDSGGAFVWSTLSGTGISPNANGIVYTPLGTNAVNTTVEARLRKMHPATIPGMIDSSGAYTAANNKAALQQAINDLGTAGGTIVIDSGTYFIESGLTIAPTQKCIHIKGLGSGIAYDDNEGGTILKFSGGGVAFDLNTGLSGAAGPYAKLSNLYIVGTNTCTHGIVLGGNVELENVVCSYFTTAGIWMKSWLNSTVLKHVTCVANGTYGMLVGSGAVTIGGAANTIFSAIDCTFRGNVTGVRIEQAQGYAFRNCNFESNTGHGLILYQRSDLTGASQHNTATFDTCYFEANSSASDVDYNLYIAAEIASSNTLNTPSNIQFNTCVFVSYMTATPTVSKTNMRLEAGNNIYFNKCQIITGGPSSDLTYASPVVLASSTYGIRFLDTIGAPSFTDAGTGNSTAAKDYYKQSSYTAVLRDGNAGAPNISSGTAYYTVSGNVVTIDMPTLTGTSTNSAKTVTGIPAHLYPVADKGFAIPANASAGAATCAWASLAMGTGNITMYSDGGGNLWPTSGSVTLRATSFSYTLA